MKLRTVPVKLRRWLAFCILCLLGASRWLVPGLGSPVAGQPMALVAGALLAAIFAWARVVSESRPPFTRWLRGASGGVLLLLGLQLPLVLRVPGSDETVALAICPVVVAVAASAFRSEAPENLTGQLWPGLAAVAGLLLLLPEPSLSNHARGLALLGAPLLAGVGAVLVCGEDGASAWLRAAALSGVLFGACVVWALQDSMQPLRSIASSLVSSLVWTTARAGGIEAAWLLLSVSVLLWFGAIRWSAIFAVVPLLLTFEGALLLGPQLGVRPFIGTGLLLLASVFLLLAGEGEGHANASSPR